ncbi:M48 family metalloprotease [uncultured Pseudodesulfovibrio sp.]|uniref:beta-barrel assembly-enhancing protease n=1 Tax=uncultured Pseudodesulfovibrio sp. TaxID=2035858 RepID=UPI0029C9000C|nr:M48 family metalloprotease [uncultured Pseudodesulfovibrio sp.]
MKRRLATLPAFFAALLVFLAPMVDAHANSLLGDKLTLRDENKMGREFDQVIRSHMNMVGDTYITDFVGEVVDRIVTGKRPMPFKVQSAVIANPIMNAFAIPGGFIYIFTGLIQEVTSESQLAGVISHELAHVSQRHVVNRIEKQKKIGLLSTVGVLTGLLLGIATGSGDGAKMGTALAMGSSGAATQAMLNYSRDDENEADHVGLNALVKAGYNPQGMPQMFEIMQKNKWFDSGSQMPAYLSTHPGTSDRITYLNDRIARMPKEFTLRKDDNTRLHRVQVLVRAHMSPANTALAYWNDKMAGGLTPMEIAGRGVALYRLKKMDEAEKAFETALSQDGNDPLISREAGIFYFKTGRADTAFALLQKATIQNSRDAIGLFYLARLQSEAKQYKQAIFNMQKVEKLVPEDWEVHHHLGMILGESGDNFGGNLHLAYAGVYSMDIRKATLHAQKASALATTDAQQEEVKRLKELIEERAKLKK